MKLVKGQKLSLYLALNSYHTQTSALSKDNLFT